MKNPSLLSALARAFLAGEQSVAGIVERASRTLGGPRPWFQALAESYLLLRRPRHRDVVGLLQSDRRVRRDLPKLAVAHWTQEAPRMNARWPLPAIVTPGDLAIRLRLLPNDLDWFADLKGLGSRRSCAAALRHYSYRVLKKPDGGMRLIEAPKTRLKRIQGRILREILACVPPHPAAHGFVRGRSIRSFALLHTAKPVVLRMDLRDFFPSFSGARAQTFFRAAGYPEPVADILGGLCTNAAPRAVTGPGEESWIYRRPHLPQGAPTSPALANICFYRVDCRLAGLAASAGAVYTRYADDLAFSGGEDFGRRVERFSTHAAALLESEGFFVNHRKTRVMRASVRQTLAGVVVNRRLNLAREDFDLLKATLTNCARTGPETQNRSEHPAFRQHLEGRVAFAESIHPKRGAKLRRILEEIRWT